MSKTYTFSISTITPVSIGDGGALSPLVDYVLENRQIHYLDKKKLEQLFLEYPAAFDDYLKEMDDIAYAERNDVLGKMFSDYFQLESKSIAKLSIPALGIKSVEELKTIVKDVGRPFIPGSTLKGAIKATIMYDWLKNNTIGQAALDAFISYLLKNRNELRDLCNDKFVNHLDDRRRREREKEEKAIRKCKDVADYLDHLFTKEIENKLFGDLGGGKRMDASLIQVTDSQPISINELCGIGLFRLRLFPKLVDAVPISQKVQQVKPKIASDSPWANLNNVNPVEQVKIEPISIEKKQEIPLIREAITANAQNITTFSLQIVQELKASIFNYDLKFLNHDISSLLSKINQFARDYVAFETQTLKEQSLEYRSKISNYDSFISETLSDKIDIVDDANEALLCVGMGKSYLLNSIGLLIANKDKKQFQRFREIYKLGDMKDVEFPATRTLCKESQLPLGWIKLKLIKNS